MLAVASKTTTTVTTIATATTLCCADCAAMRSQPLSSNRQSQSQLQSQSRSQAQEHVVVSSDAMTCVECGVQAEWADGVMSSDAPRGGGGRRRKGDKSVSGGKNGSSKALRKDIAFYDDDDSEDADSEGTKRAGATVVARRQQQHGQSANASGETGDRYSVKRHEMDATTDDPKGHAHAFAHAVYRDALRSGDGDDALLSRSALVAYLDSHPIEKAHIFSNAVTWQTFLGRLGHYSSGSEGSFSRADFVQAIEELYHTNLFAAKGEEEDLEEALEDADDASTSSGGSDGRSQDAAWIAFTGGQGASDSAHLDGYFRCRSCAERRSDDGQLSDDSASDEGVDGLSMDSHDEGRLMKAPERTERSTKKTGGEWREEMRGLVAGAHSGYV